MSITTTTPTGSRSGLLRGGLVLATALAALDLAGGIATMANSDAFGLAVAVGMIALAVVTLVLVVLAWRGSRRAAAGAAVARVVASLAGIPAFLLPEAPAFLVVLAAAGIVLALVCAALVAAGLRRRS